MSAHVIYDHREERSTIPGLLALDGLSCESAQLAVGDYILSDRLVVERKTATDLIASIKDRRLWEQMGRLKEAYPIIILILEGAPTRFPSEGWKGALGSVMTMGGVSIIQTLDAEETAEWIARLARREERGPTSARGGKRKSKDPDRLLEAVLSSLPGISSKGAERLLDHFGNLNAVFAADAEELEKIPGIGRKRATELAAIFSHTWRTPPWQK